MTVAATRPRSEEWTSRLVESQNPTGSVEDRMAQSVVVQWIAARAVRRMQISCGSESWGGFSRVFRSRRAVAALCLDIQIPGGLQVHPELAGGAEGLGEVERSHRCHPALAACVLPAGLRKSSSNISPG